MDKKMRPKQQGSSLLEVLVAIVVLSLGLLGMAGLQSTSLRSNQNALQRSQAVALSYGIMDSMRANVRVARSGGYNYDFGAGPNTEGSSIRDKDIFKWFKDMKAVLGPGLQAEICQTNANADTTCATAGTGTYTMVRIEWSGQSLAAGVADDSKENSATKEIVVVGRVR